MVRRGLSQSHEGQKVDGLLLLHFFGGPLLGDFSARASFSSGGSRLGFAGCVEESPLEMSICQGAAWASCTYTDKVVT